RQSRSFVWLKSIALRLIIRSDAHLVCVREPLTHVVFMAEPFDPYHKWLGIAPKDQPPNHYRLLGIELFEDDADVIDAAANRLSAYLEGCNQGAHLAQLQKLLEEVAAARRCLLDEGRKAQYDAELQRT